jgi:hypothetical protein
MKIKNIVTFSLLCLVIFAASSCKKEEKDDLPIEQNKEVPTKIKLQNSVTAATIATVTITYGAEERIAGMQLVGSNVQEDYTLNYNQTGNLNTVSILSGTNNLLYNFEYSNSNRLNKIIENDNGTTNTSIVNYLSTSNTYVVAGSQRRITLDANNNLEKLEGWFFNSELELTAANNADGVFANVSLDPSVSVFMNGFNLYCLNYLFLHKKQLTNYTSSTTITSNTEFQNHTRDDNGNLISFQYQTDNDDPIICTIEYTIL